MGRGTGGLKPPHTTNSPLGAPDSTPRSAAAQASWPTRCRGREAAGSSSLSPEGWGKSPSFLRHQSQPASTMCEPRRQHGIPPEERNFYFL